MKNVIKFLLISGCLLGFGNGFAQVYKPGSEPIKQAPAQHEPKFPDGKQFAGSELTYKLIEAAGNTYGYDIYSNNKLMIHQPSVPGLPGNGGFKTKQGAESVAKLVVKKIKNGEMPPTVSIEEMKKLKAIE